MWFLNGLKPGEVFLRFLLDTQEPALRRKGALLRLLQLRLKSLNTLFGLLQLLRYPLCRADSTIGGLAWVVCLSIMMMPLPIFRPHCLHWERYSKPQAARFFQPLPLL